METPHRNAHNKLHFYFIIKSEPKNIFAPSGEEVERELLIVNMVRDDKSCFALSEINKQTNTMLKLIQRNCTCFYNYLFLIHESQKSRERINDFNLD